VNELTLAEYTWPFGKDMGGLESSMTFPLILQTRVELTWCDIGTSLANTFMSSPHVGQSMLPTSASGFSRRLASSPRVSRVGDRTAVCAVEPKSSK